MKKFRATHMQAAAIMIDDHLKVGGQLFRVTGVQNTDHGTWIIRLKPSKKKPKTFVRSTILTVPRETRLKVYNQK